MTERCPVHGRPLVDTAHDFGQVCPMCRARRSRRVVSDARTPGVTPEDRR